MTRKLSLVAIEESLQIADDFLASHPDSVEMQIMSLFLRAEISGRQIQIELSDDEQLLAQRASVMGFQG